MRGFFHWTAVDNYEWTHGYTAQFGLFDRDRNPKAQRRARPRGGPQAPTDALRSTARDRLVRQAGDSRA